MRSPTYHHSTLSQEPTQHGNIEGARSKRCQAPRAVDKSWAPTQKLLFASSPALTTICLWRCRPTLYQAYVLLFASYDLF